MKYLYTALFLLILLCSPNRICGQNKTVPILEQTITIHMDNININEILSCISKKTGAIFSYNPNILKFNEKISAHFYNKPVRLVLHEVLGPEVNYKSKGKYIILKKNKNYSGRKTKTIQGYIRDSHTGEKLKGASIYDNNFTASAITNEYGYFSLEIPSNVPISSLRVSKVRYNDTLLVTENLDKKIQDIAIVSNSKNHYSDTSRISNSVLPKLTPLWIIPKKTLTNSVNISEKIMRSAQFSLAPFISTSHFVSGNKIYKLSYNLTVGYNQGVQVAEYGGIINIDLGDVKYAQAAGVGNIVGGKVTGFQGAGTFNYAKTVKGIQMSGGINITKDSAIVQFAGVSNNAVYNKTQASGVVNYSKESEAQTAGIVNISDSAKIQLAGIVNVCKKVGFQISGVINRSESAQLQLSGLFNSALKSKLQIAGVYNCSAPSIASDSSLIQIAGCINTAQNSAFQLSEIMNHATTSNVQISGLINSSGKADVQISALINKAKSVNKIQIGMINISDTCKGIPVGFFNFVKKGYHKIEISANEILSTNLTFRSGTKTLHTLWSAGYIFQKQKAWDAGCGLGTTLGRSENFNFDIDAYSYSLLDLNKLKFIGNLYTFYIGLDRKIYKKTSMAFGITYNILNFDNKNINNNPQYTSLVPRNLSFSNQSDIKSWIGCKLGFRFF